MSTFVARNGFIIQRVMVIQNAQASLHSFQPWKSRLLCNLRGVLQIAGMALCIGANLLVRRVLKRRADLQARLVTDEAYERAHPEEFALEREDE